MIPPFENNKDIYAFLFTVIILNLMSLELANRKTGFVVGKLICSLSSREDASYFVSTPP